MGEVKKTILECLWNQTFFILSWYSCKTFWGWKYISGMRIKHFQLYLDICVKYLGVETCFWEMCTTQHFSFYPDICGHPFGGGFKVRKYRNTAVVSGMCKNPNISIFNNSILIFVPNIWGAGNIFLGAVLEWMGEAGKSIMECVKTFFGSRQIGPRIIGPRTVGPRRDVGAQLSGLKNV